MSPAASRASLGLSCLLWVRITSAICSFTGSTGFKEVMGSWKIMDTCLPRIPRRYLASLVSTSWPSRMICPSVTTPGGLGIRPSTARPVVVFPAPVSPTTPRAWPFFRVRFRPFTAFTTLSLVLYSTHKLLISSTFSVLLFVFSRLMASLLFQSRIQRVPQPVAQQIQRQNGQHDRDARYNGKVAVVADVGAPACQKAAPFGGRCLHAHP